MMQLSAVIITRNEESNIKRCLESVRFADEIIVVDNNSSDKTVPIAESLGAKVYTTTWKGFGAAKQEGVNYASGEWILSIDADEEIPEMLAKEIQAKLASTNGCAGYYLNRKTMFLGKWINHCGWYPDYVIRLFQKNKGEFDDAIVHEKAVVDGAVGYLNVDMLHYSYPDLESYLNKFNRYTTLGAEEAFRKGKKAGWFDILIKPPVSFIKHYIVKQGFRDGWAGLVLSALSAMSVMVKYAKLRTLQNNRQKK